MSLPLEAPGRPLRVLHVITRMIVGGAQENTLYSCAMVDRGRFPSEILCGNQTGVEGELFGEAGREGVPVHREPSLVRELNPVSDVLAAAGVRYDSSVFPVVNYRYGIPNAPRGPYRVPVAGGSLFEFPISTLRLLGQNLPVAGGAYFRILPYAITRAAFRRLNRAGQAATFYLHPWELDPEHPRISLPRRVAATHYANLAATDRRLQQLLRDFSFAPMGDVLGVAAE